MLSKTNSTVDAPRRAACSALNAQFEAGQFKTTAPCRYSNLAADGVFASSESRSSPNLDIGLSGSRTMLQLTCASLVRPSGSARTLTPSPVSNYSRGIYPILGSFGHDLYTTAEPVWRWPHMINFASTGSQNGRGVFG